MRSFRRRTGKKPSKLANRLSLSTYEIPAAMAGIFVCMERWYLNNVIMDKQHADYIRPLVVIFGRISLLIWLVSAYNVDGAPVNTNKVMGIFIHESICDYHKRFECVTVMLTSANE